MLLELRRISAGGIVVAYLQKHRDDATPRGWAGGVLGMSRQPRGRDGPFSSLESIP
jgi:hypothetical protein